MGDAVAVTPVGMAVLFEVFQFHQPVDVVVLPALAQAQGVQGGDLLDQRLHIARHVVAVVAGVVVGGRVAVARFFQRGGGYAGAEVLLDGGAEGGDGKRRGVIV